MGHETGGWHDCGSGVGRGGHCGSEQSARGCVKADKGGIGLAESTDGVKWKFRRTVIREPFVLAYPFVFEWQGEYYIIPEAHTETSVRLDKATAFPDEWKYEGTWWRGRANISSVRRIGGHERVYRS